jgi:hypothetical protein
VLAPCAAGGTDTLGELTAHGSVSFSSPTNGICHLAFTISG